MNTQKKTTSKGPVKRPASKTTKAKTTKAKTTKAKTPAPSKFIWDPKVARDRDMAREVFGIFRKKHFLAKRLDAEGHPGDEMSTFDPDAGVMIFNPAPNRYGRIAKAEL